MPPSKHQREKSGAETVPKQKENKHAQESAESLEKGKSNKKRKSDEPQAGKKRTKLTIE